MTNYSMIRMKKYKQKQMLPHCIDSSNKQWKCTAQQEKMFTFTITNCSMRNQMLWQANSQANLSTALISADEFDFLQKPKKMLAQIP